MKKRIVSGILVLVLVFACSTAALAASPENGVYAAQLKTEDGTVAVGVYLRGNQSPADGRAVFTYDKALTLKTVEVKLAAAAGIADANALESGRVTLAWALYKPSAEDTLLCVLTLEGKCGAYTGTIGMLGAEEPEKLTLVRTYRDVANSASWYYDAVYQVSGAGLMSGVGNDLFAPAATLSRGMFVAVLYRMAGRPEVSGKNIFRDVPSTAYYTDAVIWAAEHGIVSGYGDGTFGPGRPVQRQEAASMLQRYFVNWKHETSGRRTGLSSFKDSAQIEPWAVSAMQWAVAEGIFRGDEKGFLHPADSATRAEAATIFGRVMSR